MQNEIRSQSSNETEGINIVGEEQKNETEGEETSQRSLPGTWARSTPQPMTKSKKSAPSSWRCREKKRTEHARGIMDVDHHRAATTTSDRTASPTGNIKRALNGKRERGSPGM
jgi:hypothetical protein